MMHATSAGHDDEFIGWVKGSASGSASVSSARSQRSSASSVRSQRSQSNRSTSSSKGGNSLHDKLEKLDEKSASTNGSVSVRSQRSSATHSTQHSTSSRRSSSSRNSSVKLNVKLERIAEKSAKLTTDSSSSASSWRSPYQSSTSDSVFSSSKSSSTSTSKDQSSASDSVSSRFSSSKSASSSKTSSTVPVSNKKKSDSSVASRRSSVSSKSGNSSARGQQAEGIDYLEAGDYAKAILLLTQAVQAFHRHEGRKEKKAQQALATLYGYRCEALYEIGAFEASVRDARKALECEKMSQSSLGDHPYSNSGRSSSSTVLHPEKGTVLRAKVLYLLGNSLLRGGSLDGVADAFEASFDLAEKALEDAGDLTESDRKSYNTQNAVILLTGLTKQVTEGVSTLAKYDALKTKLETGSYKKNYLDVLDDTLEIAPAAIEWHVAKVKYLIGRNRWFAVANHCEQVAARAAKWDGVFSGDLADIDPFPGIPPIQELDPDFFAENSKNDEGEPHHLRVLNPKATRDAAFRLPRELLPYYLRALRLEERYKAAVLVGTALSNFDAQANVTGIDNFAENKRFTREWDTLDKTIKVKEEGDALFRDAYYDRAVTLYGECLALDGGADGSSGSILRQASNWPVASTKANDAGGKLHAVLHSNRAACFSSMGRYDDAIKESSHAIEIHSMYTKAIIRRARCYAKSGQNERARADFNRYLILVEGAREFPYPPPNQGSSCNFDMPSDVSERQLGVIKSEMNELGMQPIEKRGKQSKMKNTTARRGRSNKWLEKLCCKKSVRSQVVTQPSHWPTSNGRARSGGSGQHPVDEKRKVSFSSTQQARGPSATPPPQSALPPDPPHNNVNPTLIKSRPAFDHPLDPPIAIDTNIDYYEILGLASLASDSDIKQAYHKLARVYHPDRNKSKEAQARFQEIKVAYAILGDTKGKKREYDKAKPGRLDP